MATRGGRKVSGGTRLRRVLRRLPEQTDRHIRPAIQEGAERILGAAQTNAPRNSGNLIAQMTTAIAKSGLQARVGFTTKTRQREAFYAAFYELYGFTDRGGRYHPPAPFLKPAFDEVAPWLRKELDRAIGAALRQAAGR